jgi:membrane protein
LKQFLYRFLNLRPVQFVAHIIHIYFKKHVSRSAAQLAYFLALTFFPILICVTAFAGMVNVQLGDLLSDLSHLFPDSVYGILRDYLGYLDNNLSAAMLFTGGALAVFFASSCLVSAVLSPVAVSAGREEEQATKEKRVMRVKISAISLFIMKILQ